MKEQPQAKPNVARPWLFIILFIVILAVGSLYLWNRTQNNLSVKNTISTESIVTVQNVGDINGNLFNASGLKNNYGIGYLKDTANTVSKNLISIARAKEDNYRPVVFYSLRPAQLNIPQVYYYDFKTNQQIQLTKDSDNPAANPVFSSRNQLVAYEKYLEFEENASQGIEKRPNYELCDSVIMDMTNQKITKVIPHQESVGENKSNCLKPVSWSPDGKALILTLDKFYVYIPKKDTIKPIEGSEFSDKQIVDMGYGVQWINEENFTATYKVNGEVLIYKFNYDNQNLTKINPQDSLLRNVITTSNEFYYMATDKQSSDTKFNISHTGHDGGNPQVVPGIGAVSDYLVSLNEKSEAEKIIFSGMTNISDPNITDVRNDGIYSIGLDGKNLKRFTGYVPKLVGWVSDYNHILSIYKPGGSGATTTEIHLLNLQTGEDKIVFIAEGI